MKKKAKSGLLAIIFFSIIFIISIFVFHTIVSEFVIRHAICFGIESLVPPDNEPDSIKAIMFKSNHSFVLGLNINTVTIKNKNDVNSALTEYNTLNKSTKAVLNSENTLINDLLKKIATLEAAAKKTNRGTSLWKKISLTDKILIIVGILTLMFTILNYNNVKNKEKKKRREEEKLFYKREDEYRNFIQEKYRTIELPFCKDHNLLLMDKIFIDLYAKEKKTQKVALNALLENDKSILLGSPGAGKSLLCKKLLFEYAKNKEEIRIPILIILRAILNTKQDIHTYVKTQISERFGEITKDSITETLLKKGKFLIIFDGYDEVMSDPKYKNEITDFINNNNNCGYIITCRENVYENDFDSILSENKGKYSLVGFSPQQIKKYIEARNTSNVLIEELLIDIYKRVDLKDLAQNPLMLSMIIFLYGEEKKLPYSKGEFYSLVTCYLLQDNKDKLDSVDLDLNLQSLSCIAWYMHCEGWQRIKKEKIIELLIEELNFDKQQALIKFDTFVRSKLIYESEGTQSIYEYRHYTIQEYFVALYINKYYQGNKNKKDILLENFKANNRWREIVKMFSNIYDDDVSTFLFDLYEIKINNNTSVALECMAETKFPEQNIANKILDQHLEQSVEEWEITVPKTMGLLISSIKEEAIGEIKKKIGEKVFIFFKEQLNRENLNDEELKIITESLAYSCTKEACELIICYKKDKSDIIFNALKEIGNLAITYLVSMAKNGHNNAVFYLNKIAMLNENDEYFDCNKAIEAMIELLWEKDEKAIATIPYLSKKDMIDKLELIFTNNYYEDTKINSIKKNGFEYIWEPFDNASMNLIISRMSYLIFNNFDEINFSAPIDNRIAIPLRIKELYERKHEKIKSIIDDDHNVKLEKTIERETGTNLEYWLDKWANVNNRDKEYIFEDSNRKSFLLLLQIGLMFCFFFLFLPKSSNYSSSNTGFIFLVMSVLCLVSIVYLIILDYPNIDREIYSKKEILPYMKFGFTSKKEILILCILILSSSPIIWIFIHKDYDVTMYFLYAFDFQLFLYITLIIWARYKKWNSKNPLSELIEAQQFMGF